MNIDQNWPLPAAAHPVLPAMVSKVFGWKVFHPPPDINLPYHWIDTGREVFSLPHFNHAAGPILALMPLLSELTRLQHYAAKPLGLRLPCDSTLNFPKKMVSTLRLIPRAIPKVLVHGNLARKIRAAQHSGILVERQGSEGLNEFMTVYCQRLHELGSASLPKSFFGALMSSYPDKALDAEVFLHLARYQGRCVGAAFSLRFGPWFENGWFATDLNNRSLNVAYALHNAMILDALETGALVYSFGRSTPGSGVHRFKQQWGTSDLPVYHFRLPASTFDLRNYPVLNRLWKRVPIMLTRPFNNYIAKWMY